LISIYRHRHAADPSIAGASVPLASNRKKRLALAQVAAASNDGLAAIAFAEPCRPARALPSYQQSGRHQRQPHLHVLRRKIAIWSRQEDAVDHGKRRAA